MHPLRSLILQLEISGAATKFESIVTHLTEFERRMGPKDGTGEAAFGTTSSGNRKFKGKCFYCHKKGHKKDDCRTLKKDEKEGNVTPSASGSGSGPSTRPLATPSRGRGFSPPAQAQAHSATEACWMVAE